MKPEIVLEFLSRIEKLKCAQRHCATSAGGPESVADHTFGCAVFALLIRDEFPQLDMDKVLEMCLIHDFGEAVTGERWSALYQEMDALETDEAKLYKIIDRLEAVHQHNLSPLSSWIPLEYELNLTYGEKEADAFPYTRRLRQLLKQQTLEKTGK